MGKNKTPKLQKRIVNFSFHTLNVSKEYIEHIEQKYNRQVKTKVTLNRNKEKLKKFKIFLNNLKSTDYIVDIVNTIGEIKNNKINSYDTVAGKLIELDLNTLKEDKDYIFFQVVNNRANDIPSKRKLRGKKDSIKLDDNEYIGEFMSVLYNKNTKVFMIQSNKYAVSLNQLQKLLSGFYSLYLKKHNLYEDPIVLELCPLLDPDQIDKINDKNFLENITLSASCNSLASIANSNNKAVYDLSKSLENFQGYDFTLQVRATQRGEKGKTLNQHDTLDLVKTLNEMKNSGVPDKSLPKLTVGVRESEDSPRELINWLIPSLKINIEFSKPVRTSVSEKEVNKAMKNEFDKLLDKIQLLTGKLDDD